MEVHYLDLCRLCANSENKKSPMIKIFSTHGLKLEIEHKIKCHLPIKVESGDEYPQQVCISCMSKLNVCHALTSACLEAQTKLQQLKNKAEIEIAKVEILLKDVFSDDGDIDLPVAVLLSPSGIRQDSSAEIKNETGTQELVSTMYATEKPSGGPPTPSNNPEPMMCDDGSISFFECLADESESAHHDSEYTAFETESISSTSQSPACEIESTSNDLDSKSDKTEDLPCEIQCTSESASLNAESKPDNYKSASQSSSKSVEAESVHFNTEFTAHELDFALYKPQLDGTSLERSSPCFESSHGISQVAIVIAEKNDQEKHPMLYLVLVNIEKENLSCVPVSEKVQQAIAAFKNRPKPGLKNFKVPLENAMYTCTACSQMFTDKADMVTHFEMMHPDEVWGCSECGESVCGSAEVFSRHRKLHQRNVGTDSESELLSSMTCQLDAPVETFEYKTPEFQVVRLGEFIPRARFQRSKYFLNAAIHNKAINPESKHRVIEALKKFLENFKFEPPSNSKPKYPRKMEKSTCLLCDKILNHKRSLIRHMKSMHQPNPNKEVTKHEPLIRSPCCHCNKLVRDDQIAGHIECNHYGGKELMCRVCDRVYKITGEVQPHMQTESVNPFRCPHPPCKRGYTKMEKLSKHIEIEHEPEPTHEPCMTESYVKISSQTESKEKKQQLEINNIVPEFVLCETCGKTFDTRSKMKSHMKTHNVGTFACELCGKVYDKMYSLKGHIYSVHRDKVPCKICKKFYQKNQIKNHLRTHGKRQFACRFCGKLLSREPNLKYHEMRHEGIKGAKCLLCYRYFKSPQLLERHQITHKDGGEISIPTYVRPVKCDICNAVKENKYVLQYHMYSHTKNYPFSCSQCPKKFTFKHYLKRHVEYHHLGKSLPEIVPHKNKCQFCEKCFISSTYLRDHESKHAGTKNHNCNLCEKSYFYHSGLQKHTIKVHGMNAREYNANSVVETSVVNYLL